jgi:hypothetical protein
VRTARVIRSSIAAMLLAGANLVAGVACADTHALVIGIDAYASPKHPKLRAAVADASDLLHVLQARGVSDAQALINEQATREGFEQAWSDLTKRAKSGDTIVVTFAGHGIRVPEDGPERRSPDGWNSGFILYPYDEKAQPQQILLDVHLYDLFKTQSDRGVKIFWLVDACHAGAGVRGNLDPRIPKKPVRLETYDVAAAPPPPPPPASTFHPRPPIPGLVAFSATDERFSVEEVPIGGVLRGALSWSVARAFESTTAFSQGPITPKSLQDFVAPLVRENTRQARQQTPVFTFADPSEALIAFGGGAPPPAAPPKGGPLPALKDVKVAILGVDEPTLQEPGAIFVKDKAAADLIFDAQHGRLENNLGDVIASCPRLGEECTPERFLPRAIAARRVVDSLVAAMAKGQAPLPVTLKYQDGAKAGTPVDGPLAESDKSVSLQVPKLDTPYVTAFDVTAEGAIDFIYPIETSRIHDPVAAPPGQPLDIRDVPINEPFGLDTVVFITTPSPLPELHKTLLAIDPHGGGKPGGGDGVDLFDALQAALRGTSFRIGIQSQVTCKIVKDGLCDWSASSTP